MMPSALMPCIMPSMMHSALVPCILLGMMHSASSMIPRHESRGASCHSWILNGFKCLDSVEPRHHAARAVHHAIRAVPHASRCPIMLCTVFDRAGLSKIRAVHHTRHDALRAQRDRVIKRLYCCHYLRNTPSFCELLEPAFCNRC